MALSYIASGGAQANTVTIPAGHAAGDLLLIFAFRDGSTTSPSIPAGWTSVGLNAGTLCASTVAYKIATSSSETSGTWTNADALVCNVYRGQFYSGTPVINSGGQTGTSSTVNYSGIVSMTDAGNSWVVRFAGNTSIDTALETPPTGHTFRAGNVGATCEVASFDTNGAVSSSSFGSTSVGGTTGNYITKTLEILADHAGTGVEAKANQLTGPAATGNNATTDPGIQPKALFIWNGLQTATGAIADAQFNLGVASSTTTETAGGYNSDDNVATSDAVRITNTARLINSTAAGTATNNLVADLTSFDFTGFTMNWSTLSTTSPLYNYLVIGGQDITAVKSGSFAANTTTGNQAITGVGFQPDVVFLFATLQSTSAASNNNSQYGFGVMDKNGGQWSVSQKAQNTVNPANTNRAFSNAAALVLTQTAADNFAHKVSFVSMDTDGFTVSVDVSVGLAIITGYMAIKGGSWKVGTDTQKTSTGTQAKTGVGFQPKGIIFGTVCDTGTDAVATNGRFGIGATTGTSNNVSIWTGDKDAVTPTVANTIMSSTKCIVIATEGASASPTTNAEAALSSFDSDGYTLNWSTADATARTFGYVAFGNNASAPATANSGFFGLF